MEIAKIFSDPSVSAAFATWAQALFTMMALGALISASRQIKLASLQVQLVKQEMDLVRKQIEIAQREIVADHDRSRKELSIQLGADWIAYQNNVGTAAIRILAKLNEDDTASLLGKEPFSIDRKYEPELREALHKHPLPKAIGSDRIDLSREQVIELRAAIVDYLNRLEVIFSAWKSGVADRAMIEEEFLYLMEKSNYLGEHFRQAATTGDWPAIHAFVTTWRNKTHVPSVLDVPLIGTNEAGEKMAMGTKA